MEPKRDLVRLRLRCLDNWTDEVPELDEMRSHDFLDVSATYCLEVLTDSHEKEEKSNE